MYAHPKMLMRLGRIDGSCSSRGLPQHARSSAFLGKGKEGRKQGKRLKGSKLDALLY
jgi:hypothetical protein